MKDNNRSNRDWLARTRLLLGDDLVERLHDSHVLVVGLGGVGAYAAEMICRAGVGTMTIIDGDIVEVTNLNRQLPAMTSTLDTPKVDVVTKRLLDINPRLKLYALNEFLRDERTDEVLDATTFHYVVDAIDSLSPKINLIAKCYDRNIPIISSMGSGGRFDPAQIRIGDISDTYNCRLAKMVRKRLHRRGINRGVKVIFSPENVDDEAVEVYEDEEENTRSMVGTISYLPALFGCQCASVVIRDILGKTY